MAISICAVLKSHGFIHQDALAKRFAPFPAMTIEKSGYGAGTRDLPGQANVVRLTIGESQDALAANTSQETISVLEANLDDLNPQVFGYAVDRLLDGGALDVFASPVQMKKSRPGTHACMVIREETIANREARPRNSSGSLTS